MTKYKVTYFDATWLGEPLRFLLSYEGLEFEDYRHTFASWEIEKHNYPIQHVPTLEIDGKFFIQSVSICRYLANKFGIAGDDIDKRYLADVVVDTVLDLRSKVMAIYLDKDDKTRAIKVDEALKGPVPLFLGYLNTLAKENNGYFVKGQLSWADLFYSSQTDLCLKYLGNDVFDKYPELVALNERIRTIPNIKKWIETRPGNLDE